MCALRYLIPVIGYNQYNDNTNMLQCATEENLSELELRKEWFMFQSS